MCGWGIPPNMWWNRHTEALNASVRPTKAILWSRRSASSYLWWHVCTCDLNGGIWQNDSCPWRQNYCLAINSANCAEIGVYWYQDIYTARVILSGTEQSSPTSILVWQPAIPGHAAYSWTVFVEFRISLTSSSGPRGSQYEPIEYECLLSFQPDTSRLRGSRNRATARGCPGWVKSFKGGKTWNDM